MSEQKQLTVGVTGMTCAACSSRIEKVLSMMDGVDAQVNLTTEKANIDYNSEITFVEKTTTKIENFGYGVETEKTEVDVIGMTCPACSSRIEKVLNKQPGIKQATVNLTTENATVEYNPGMMNAEDIIGRIQKTGYDAKIKADKQEKQSRKEKQIKRMKWKLIISAVLSVPLLLTMLVHLFGVQLPAIFMNPWFQFALASPLQFIIGWQFYDGAYKNL